MMIPPASGQPGDQGPAHSDEVLEVHRRMLGVSPVRGR